jgi:hypothetical protein
MRIILNMPKAERTIDMNPDGSFAPPRATPLADRILRGAVVLAALAGMVAFGLLALWAALIAIPVALGAGAVAYAAWRWRVWRAGGGFGSR